MTTLLDLLYPILCTTERLTPPLLSPSLNVNNIACGDQKRTTVTASTITSGSTSQSSGSTIDFTRLEILRGDQFVYQSPNKLCITGLAPSHPLLCQRDRYQVLNLQFEPKILSALPQPTAIPANSKKQPPPFCHSDTVICKIEARDLWWSGRTTDNNGKESSQKEQEELSGDEPPIVHGIAHRDTEDAGTEGVDISLSGLDTREEITASISASASALASASASVSTSASVSDSETHSPSTNISRQKLQGSSDPSRVLFVIRAAIQGHVIELNERLVRRGSSTVTDPDVIQTLLDKVQMMAENGQYCYPDTTEPWIE